MNWYDPVEAGLPSEPWQGCADPAQPLSINLDTAGDPAEIAYAQPQIGQSVGEPQRRSLPTTFRNTLSTSPANPAWNRIRLRLPDAR